MDGKVITKSPELDSPGHIDPVVDWVRKLVIRPDLLPGLAGEFGLLVKAEAEILKGCSPLGAICDYDYKSRKQKPKWTELRPDDQPGFVFRDGPEDNYQRPRKDFWRKFETVANKAGKTVRSRPDSAPCDSFVYYLFIYLLKIKSHRLSGADHEGGIINELCEAARDFIAEITQIVAVEEFEGKQNSEKKDQPAEATEAPADNQQTEVDVGETTESGLPKPVLEGKRCAKVIDEVSRIKNFHASGGRTMNEIREEWPNYEVWRIVEQLPQEDQETFERPSMWGPKIGYARLILSKHYGNSTDTINDWVKAYKKHERSKNQKN